MKNKQKIFYAFLSSILFAVSAIALEPNPPTWTGTVATGGVFVFDPSNAANNEQTIADIFAKNGGSPDLGQWSDFRYALLFLPGAHEYDVNVGYYTSVIGLGTSPDDTIIGNANGGGVICEEGNLENYAVGALNTFWRSAENFQTEPNGQQGWEWTGGVSGFLWAASQASPLRRVHVTGANPNLYLYQYVKNSGDQYAGYASGGFMADCTVDGTIDSGSQQQFLARNCSMGDWPNGVWNMVFVGSTNAPATNCKKYVNVDKTPLIAEKPYITYDAGKYYLQIPPVEKDKVGPTSVQPTQVDFVNVYVATAADSAATINGKLTSGLHVVLSAGIYNLTEPIVIENANTVVLGIGFPTLISTSGKPCIVVGSADGIRIGGILLQAGETTTTTLLQWGSSGDKPTNGFLYDCFARVGGTNDPAIQQLKADTMIEINSSNIVCDNLWLWRADHYGTSGGTSAGLVKNGDNPCKNAFVANGENITAYGLCPEHTLEDLSVWNGNHGSTYFFQCEYPYDVNTDYADKGYVAYRVNNNVTNHLTYGIGVYSFFRDYDVNVNTAIATPTGENLQFHSSLTVFLNGMGSISHVINGLGESNTSNKQHPIYYCPSPPPTNAFNQGGRTGITRY